MDYLELLSMKSMRCRFFMKMTVDAQASKEEGRPIHREVPYAEILKPGDRDRRHIRADEPYQYFAQGLAEATWLSAKDIWARQWEMFQHDNSSDQIVGTRLDEWGQITRAEAADLKALGVVTVEQLATLEVSAKKRLGMSGDRYVGLAQRFLDQTTESSALARRDQEIAELKAQMEQLLAERNGPKVAASVEDAAAHAEFETWDDDAIVAFMVDKGGKPDRRWGRERLIAEAAKLASDQLALA